MRKLAPLERRSDFLCPEALDDLFWPHVQRGGPGDCWPWTGHKDADGYGTQYYRVAPGRRRPMRAHRMAYLLHHGEVPGHLLVCHTCDNPPCCNPAHLFVGTNGDNMADRNAKGRTARGAAAGLAVVPIERRPQGERINTARLTADQARELRRLRRDEGVTYVALGKRFGISHVAARKIVVGENWRHLR
jgi:hypothetical protein